MKTRKIGITLILVAIMVLLGTGNVQAALQANPNTHTKKTDTLANWVKNIRQMEAADGAMGLSETINTSTLIATSESNGIDVHSIRSTEYGAMAILSASGYGNPSNDKAITTTTGNNTGVMINTADWEWTAGIANASSAGVSAFNSKYYDLYTFNDATSAKAGDALGSSTVTNPGCAGWHSAGNSTWLSGYTSCGFARGSGGIFSFYGYSYGNGGADSVNTPHWGRAVVVCGAGL